MVGPKFCDLTGSHIQQTDGRASVMKDGEPIEMYIRVWALCL